MIKPNENAISQSVVSRSPLTKAIMSGKYYQIWVKLGNNVIPTMAISAILIDW